jgi:hypothetical protein
MLHFHKSTNQATPKPTEPNQPKGSSQNKTRIETPEELQPTAHREGSTTS